MVCKELTKEKNNALSPFPYCIGESHSSEKFQTTRPHSQRFLRNPMHVFTSFSFDRHHPKNSVCK